MNNPRLLHWKIVLDPFSFCTKEPKKILCGDIYDDTRTIKNTVDKRFLEGHPVLTSEIMSIKIDSGCLVATTKKGTHYTLEQASDEYVLWCFENNKNIGEPMDYRKGY